VADVVGGELVRLDSIEQARDFHATIDSFRIRQLDRGEFRWSSRSATVGPVVMRRGRYDVSVEVGGNFGADLFLLTLPTAGHAEGGPAGEPEPMVAGATAVIAAATRLESRFDAGWEGIQLVIPRDLFARNLTALLGVDTMPPIAFAPRIDIADGAGAALARLLTLAADEVRRPAGALASPLVASNIVDALVHHMLLRLPHNHIARLHAPVRPAEPGYLRQAEEFLVANVDRPVSNVELAERVGVSVRAIELAFRRHRDLSPQRFLRERRLELARRRLVARTGGTVSDIAFACGFTHLGRFGAEYRARFGESPSQTLRDPADKSAPRG
jgi:AraC-like DNA-binding protein